MLRFLLSIFANVLCIEYAVPARPVRPITDLATLFDEMEAGRFTFIGQNPTPITRAFRLSYSQPVTIEFVCS